jgi:hypothetical protein
MKTEVRFRTKRMRAHSLNNDRNSPHERRGRFDFARRVKTWRKRRRAWHRVFQDAAAGPSPTLIDV